MPELRSGRDHGATLAHGRARPAQYRSQGDFRRPELANVADDRLGARRARACARSSSGCSTSGATAGRGPSGRTRPTWKTPPRFARNGPIGRDDPAATQALLQVIRQATPEAASAEAVKLLNQGIAPGSLWDAAILAACELLMHSPGILALHATTATNALHYIYTASGDDTTRRLALLQAVGWQPMFRGRVKLTDATGIDSLKASPDMQLSSGDEAVGEIFATINDDRKKAGGKAMAYLARGGSPDLIFDAARRMIFHKGRDSHDYKYGAALWEGMPLVDRAQMAQSRSSRPRCPISRVPRRPTARS